MNYMTLTDKSALPCFYVPKTLFTSKNYQTVSADSKLLYGLLLEKTRVNKITSNGDLMGRDFVLFSKKDLAQELGYSEKNTLKFIKELENVCLVKKMNQHGEILHYSVKKV